MTSIWAESIGESLQVALGMLADAVTECPDDLWKRPMWEVDRPDAAHVFLGPDWKPITDASELETLATRWVERRSTPWSVAWHALEVLDYDLSGELEPWAPPPPFFGHPHWRDLPSLPQAWSKADIVGYIDYCRGRTQEVLAAMTDERARTPLAATHRYAGRPYARIVTGLIVHTAEHAAQVRQFAGGTQHP